MHRLLEAGKRADAKLKAERTRLTVRNTNARVLGTGRKAGSPAGSYREGVEDEAAGSPTA